MTTEAIIESGMTFGPYAAGECFYVEKSIYKYLLKNDYSDEADRITGAYHKAKKDGNVHSIYSAVKYDLISKIAEGTQLTRRTAADILNEIEKTKIKCARKFFDEINLACAP